MPKILRVLFAGMMLATLGVLLPQHQAVLAASPPAISGTVINGTSGEPVAGQDMTLTVFTNSTPTDTKQTVTDSAGNYAFSGLSVNSTVAYSVSTTYKSVQYGSDILQLTADNATQTADIKVYETTTTDPGITLTGGHVIILPASATTLNVLEAWAFTNPGDRTYIGSGSNGATSHFTLPAGATGFVSGNGITADNATRIVTDTMPKIPGTNTIYFTYNLPYQGGQALINIPVDYDIPDLSVLVPDNGVSAQSTTLSQSTQSFQGVNYLVFSGVNLKAGQNVDLSLTINPSDVMSPSSSSTQSSRLWLWVLLAVVVLGIVVWQVIPRLRAGGVAVESGEEALPEGEDIEEAVLLERLARLDDRFEAGEIAEDDYRQRRARIKDQLISIREKK